MATSNTLTHWGPFLVESDGNEVTEVRGHPTDPSPSTLGQGMKAVTQCRIAKPAVRQSWLAGGYGSSPELRGREPFVEIEWDEAFDLVATELARVRDAHGFESIYAGSYGWGSAGQFHMAGSQVRRFMRAFGGYVDRRGTYSSCAAEMITPYIYGINWYPACAQQTAWAVIAEHTELFVSFGSLRVNNAQVHFGGQGPHHTAGWIAKAASNGTTFVNVGPVRDDQSTEANGRWLPIRPGTDVALMAALAHTLVVEDLANTDFLDSHCHGWPQMLAYLVGDEDGVAKSAAWAADITTIPEADIVALAREMAAKRTIINLSFAVQRADHGEQSYWMAAALAAALGQIGTPGGGIAFPFGSHGRAGNGEWPTRIPRLPVAAPNPDMPIIPVSHIAQMLENPGGAYNFDGQPSVYPDARLVYWAGGNVFHHHQDLNRLVRAWQRPETIVVHEPYWTPMAKFADIVLPATTHLERSDLGDGETMLVAMQPAIERQGDALDDYDIFAGIADRLGMTETFTEGRTSQQWIEFLYESWREANDHAPPFDEFWRDGFVIHAERAPMGQTDHIFLGAFRDDPAANPLKTPSGKIELFSETIAAFGYDDCPPHPTWIEPYERQGTPAATAHPFHLVSNQPTTRLHSQFDHAASSRVAKVHGREPVRLNPVDAASRGVVDGDVVRIFNERGAVLAGVVISEHIAAGIVQLATGAWYDPDDSGMCKHGNPNVLTRDKGTSQLGQGPTAHTCLVNFEKFTGELPPVTAFDPPAFVGR